jgi:hypothetical protein
LLAAAIAMMALGGASAAELPTKHAERSAPRKTCTIGGMKGFPIPGTDTCIKVSGYIEAGASVRH